MPNPYDRNSMSFVIDPVDDPAWLANYLPDSRIIELRHNGTGLWEMGQSLCCGGVVFCDEAGNVFEIKPESTP